MGWGRGFAIYRGIQPGAPRHAAHAWGPAAQTNARRATLVEKPPHHRHYYPQAVKLAIISSLSSEGVTAASTGIPRVCAETEQMHLT